MRRRAVFGTNEKTFNYGMDKCLSICESTLNVIDKDEALVLRNLNGFRDASVHDILDIGEGLLYGHAQSAVQIFATLLKKVFGKDLHTALPNRILPIATVLPSDITTIVAQDMENVRALLGQGRRREEDAEAKLRAYMVVEKNIREMQGIAQPPPSTATAIRALKTGDWKSILPMVAGLVQPTSGGIAISLHVTRSDGFPVRVDPKAPTAIAFRYIKPEDKYPYLTKELAEKLGISAHQVVLFVKLFQMKGNDDYHTAIKISSTSKVQRYSEKAYRVLSTALSTEGQEKLLSYVRQNKTLDPKAYMLGPTPSTVSSSQATSAGA